MLSTDKEKEIYCALFPDFLAKQYSAMPLEKLQELANNLSAQLTLINSIIHEKCPDQEDTGNA